MKLPLEISFQGMARSEALEASVERHAAKLERFHTDIVRCRVSLVLDEKHKQQGNPFTVAIDVTVPGQELVANRNAHEDLYVALGDAFKDMTRMLDDAASKRRDLRRA